ncbi:MAG: histone deacetylase [Phycisphaerales bacterium]|nr:histone deacetylase [Phycisphaerales bacterium]
MADFAILLDERFVRHHTGDGHPESPERLRIITDALQAAGLLDQCPVLPGVYVGEDILQAVHTRDYLVRVEAACRQGYPFVDVPDSAVCPESYDIARLAAGGVLDAVRRVARGELQRAFCAVRPPGHHAERDRSMGFCLFNNVALAAAVLKQEFSITRILVFDFDVHHANGTQHAFEADPCVLVISMHGHPRTLYPGTGYAEEVGVGPGRGYTINIPLEPGANDADVRTAFEDEVLPAVERFAPQVVLVSAGFDGHEDDPLGNLSFSDEIFPWMTKEMLGVAERHARGRLVSVLEGGYHAGVLARCVPQHVRLLAEGG